jgi:hypothetical protein
MSVRDNQALVWNDYSIFRVDENHYDALIAISQSAFSISPTKQYYYLKNNTSSFGIPDLGYIAYSNLGEPSAFYGVFACKAEYDGISYQIAQSGDTMTHKNHTGKGLFTKLAELTYELCRQEGYCFVYGFPNYNSYPGFSKKLHWVFPGKLREYKIKVLTIPLVKLVKKIGILLPIYLCYRNLINLSYRTDVDKFQSSTITSKSGGIERTAAFVKYKQKITDSYFVKLGNAIAWLKTDGFLFVGDIQLNGDNFESCFDKLKNYARLIGADVITFQSTGNSRLDLMFSKYDKPKEGLPWGFRKFNDTIDPELINYVTADFDTF